MMDTQDKRVHWKCSEVPHPPCRADKMSTTEVRDVTFRAQWTIKNFRACKEEICSEKFSASGVDENKFYMRLWPRGRSEGNSQFVSLFLALDCKPGVEIFANFRLWIGVASDCDESTEMNCFRFVPGVMWGCQRFISRNQIFQKRSGLLLGEDLVITCQLCIEENRIVHHSIESDKLIVKKGILKSVKRLYENNFCCDVKFYVGDQKEAILAHKAVLTARSSYFDGLFRNLKTNSRIEHFLPDISPRVFYEVLRFIYTDEALFVNHLARELLVAASRYSLTKLKTICEDHLISQLTVENVADMLRYSDSVKAHSLRDGCVHMIITNLDAVEATDGWKRISKSLPQEKSMESPTHLLLRNPTSGVVM